MIRVPQGVLMRPGRGCRLSLALPTTTPTKHLGMYQSNLPMVKMIASAMANDVGLGLTILSGIPFRLRLDLASSALPTGFEALSGTQRDYQLLLHYTFTATS
ncbi:unnamed protein product [Protopolystoma xenopodis]|uniref:Uncharacterized protein n=1 Tax=Protopolystoma xenopodis TaxID=117903 RepID=A0A3S5CLY1_9PLAT|nr:unnamed protein product [Protopolystoma xenopodis]